MRIELICLLKFAGSTDTLPETLCALPLENHSVSIGRGRKRSIAYLKSASVNTSASKPSATRRELTWSLTPRVLKLFTLPEVWTSLPWKPWRVNSHTVPGGGPGGRVR